MIRIIFVIVFQTILFASAQSQTAIAIETDINSLFPQGKLVAEVFDSVKASQRQVELISKFQEGIKKNYDWFIDYMKDFKEGGMPYHENLGLSKDEYQEYLDLSSNFEMIASEVDTIIVTKTETLITFESHGKLEFLKYLKLYPKENKILLFGYLLSYSESPNIIDDKNAFKSKWKGHTWRLEEPKDINLDDLKDISNVSLRLYKVTIGRLEKNGATFCIVTGKEYRNGKSIVNFELPIIIKM